MAEAHVTIGDVTQDGNRIIPTITVARPDDSQKNLLAFSRNESSSASQITFVDPPPGLINEEDSRSESSTDEDFEATTFTLENFRAKVDKSEGKYNRQLARLLRIQECKSKWSGTGEIYDVDWDDIDKEVKKDLKFKKDRKELGKGGFGIVYKVKCHMISMARKSIVAQSTERLQQIKAEINTTKKLAEGKHRHLINFVGYYRTTDDHSGITTYHILTFPVADCDLDKFLKDCEAARKADYVYGYPETQHILKASAAVDIPQHATFRDQMLSSLQSFINRSMGCMADAIMWMHSEAIAIAHQDLKPANVLLRHGRLYITDFGISRDRTGSETAQTEFVMGRSQIFSAPQIEYQEKFVPYKADVYSVGCIFLHLLSVIYGTTTIDEVNKVLQSSWTDRDDRIHDHILGFAPTFPQNRGEIAKYGYSRPPQELVNLVQGMLRIEEHDRPNSAAINKTLRDIGGEKNNYHSECCALVEATPAPDYEIIPKVTGMEVNIDYEDELHRHIWGRDMDTGLRAAARNPFASSASQAEEEQSMFGLGRPRKEHEGRRDRPSDRLISRMPKNIAEFTEKIRLEQQMTLPKEVEVPAIPEPSLPQLPPKFPSPGRKHASDTIVSDPIVASEYFEENPDSEEESEVEEGDGETAQRKNDNHGKTTRVTSTLAFCVLKHPSIR